jgi:hypothetical protein
MSEEKYRLYKLVLLAVFVVGILIIGLMIAQNGRYAPFQPGENSIIDTRTGNKYAAGS